MGRSPDKNGLKKGPWTIEEDQKLIDYIQKHGHGKWRTIPKNAGLKRCGKSCRLRWTNYLRPDIKRGRFSFHEEETIIQLHSILGNKWSAIAASLPGRTDNEIKNYWNTHIRKKLLRMGIDPVTHAPCLDLQPLSSILSSSQLGYPSDLFGTGNRVNQELLGLVTALLSSSHFKNPDTINQNFQQNQYSNTLVQNQSSQPFMQLNTAHESSLLNQPLLPVLQENQSCPSLTNFGNQNCLTDLWQYNGGCDYSEQPESAATTPSSFVPSPKLDSIISNCTLFENQNLQSNNNESIIPSCFNLGAHLSSSTPSTSSPIPLNASISTTNCFNGCSEDEMGHLWQQYVNGGHM